MHPFARAVLPRLIIPALMVLVGVLGVTGRLPVDPMVAIGLLLLTSLVWLAAYLYTEDWP